MSKRRSNKGVKRMMARVFNWKWEHFRPNMYRLVILEGYFGSCPVHCALHKTISLTASELKGE